MATAKKMTETVSPVALMGIEALDLAATGVKIPCGSKKRGNGKALPKDMASTIIQNHQCDMSVPETEPKIVLL